MEIKIKSCTEYRLGPDMQRLAVISTSMHFEFKEYIARPLGFIFGERQRYYRITRVKAKPALLCLNITVQNWRKTGEL